MRSTIKLVLVLSCIVPYTISIATSPAIPWHQYNVRGNLTRATGSKANFSVVLAGKFGRDSYQRLRGVSFGSSQFPVGITDSLGAFFINVYEGLQFDSLRVMVVLPDREPVLGTPFSVKSANVFTEYGTFTDDGILDCSGCLKSSRSKIIVTGYTYSFAEQSVAIPF
jgi:hypothetical protein